jgi:hypothetical protein
MKIPNFHLLYWRVLLAFRPLSYLQSGSTLQLSPIVFSSKVAIGTLDGFDNHLNMPSIRVALWIKYPFCTKLSCSGAHTTLLLCTSWTLVLELGLRCYHTLQMLSLFPMETSMMLGPIISCVVVSIGLDVMSKRDVRRSDLKISDEQEQERDQHHDSKDESYTPAWNFPPFIFSILAGNSFYFLFKPLSRSFCATCTHQSSVSTLLRTPGRVQNASTNQIHPPAFFCATCTDQSSLSTPLFLCHVHGPIKRERSTFKVDQSASSGVVTLQTLKPRALTNHLWAVPSFCATCTDQSFSFTLFAPLVIYSKCIHQSFSSILFI